MFKENDAVVYKKNVCRIKGIKHNDLNDKDYYILVPIDDDSLKIDIPVTNAQDLLKNVISKSEAEDIINNIKNISPLDNLSDKNIEMIYKQLLYNGTHDDLVKIIKTTYLRNEKRTNERKKISDKDSRYFNLAEKYLYNELSVAMNMSFDEVKEYIISKMES